MVSGWTGGLLEGLAGFRWWESVAVNSMAVTSVPWFMCVLLCLLRWLYAPRQYRFLYWALFIFGICFTTHQTLIVAALGVEVLIAAGNLRLCRHPFLCHHHLYPARLLPPTQHPLRPLLANP